MADSWEVVGTPPLETLAKPGDVVSRFHQSLPGRTGNESAMLQPWKRRREPPRLLSLKKKLPPVQRSMVPELSDLPSLPEATAAAIADPEMPIEMAREVVEQKASPSVVQQGELPKFAVPSPPPKPRDGAARPARQHERLHGGNAPGVKFRSSTLSAFTSRGGSHGDVAPSRWGDLKVLYTELVEAINSVSIPALVHATAQVQVRGATGWSEYNVAMTRLNVLQSLYAELEEGASGTDIGQIQRSLADALVLKVGTSVAGNKLWTVRNLAESRLTTLLRMQSELKSASRGTSIPVLTEVMRSVQEIGVGDWPLAAQADCRLRFLQSLLSQLCDATNGSNSHALSEAVSSAELVGVTDTTDAPLGFALLSARRKMSMMVTEESTNRELSARDGCDVQLIAAANAADVGALRAAVVEAEVALTCGFVNFKNKADWQAFVRARDRLAILAALEVELVALQSTTLTDNLVAAIARADAFGCTSWQLRREAAERLDKMRVIEAELLRALSENSIDLLEKAAAHADLAGLSSWPHARAARKLLQVLKFADKKVHSQVMTKFLTDLSTKLIRCKVPAPGQENLLHVGLLVRMDEGVSQRDDMSFCRGIESGIYAALNMGIEVIRIFDVEPLLVVVELLMSSRHAEPLQGLHDLDEQLTMDDSTSVIKNCFFGASVSKRPQILHRQVFDQFATRALKRHVGLALGSVASTDSRCSNVSSPVSRGSLQVEEFSTECCHHLVDNILSQSGFREFDETDWSEACGSVAGTEASELLEGFIVGACTAVADDQTSEKEVQRELSLGPEQFQVADKPRELPLGPEQSQAADGQPCDVDNSWSEACMTCSGTEASDLMQGILGRACTAVADEQHSEKERQRYTPTGHEQIGETRSHSGLSAPLVLEVGSETNSRPSYSRLAVATIDEILDGAVGVHGAIPEYARSDPQSRQYFEALCVTSELLVSALSYLAREESPTGETRNALSNIVNNLRDMPYTQLMASANAASINSAARNAVHDAFLTAREDSRLSIRLESAASVTPGLQERVAGEVAQNLVHKMLESTPSHGEVESLCTNPDQIACLHERAAEEAAQTLLQRLLDTPLGNVEVESTCSAQDQLASVQERVSEEVAQNLMQRLLGSSPERADVQSISTVQDRIAQETTSKGVTMSSSLQLDAVSMSLEGITFNAVHDAFGSIFHEQHQDSDESFIEVESIATSAARDRIAQDATAHVVSALLTQSATRLAECQFSEVSLSHLVGPALARSVITEAAEESARTVATVSMVDSVETYADRQVAEIAVQQVMDVACTQYSPETPVATTEIDIAMSSCNDTATANVATKEVFACTQHTTDTPVAATEIDATMSNCHESAIANLAAKQVVACMQDDERKPEAPEAHTVVHPSSFLGAGDEPPQAQAATRMVRDAMAASMDDYAALHGENHELSERTLKPDASDAVLSGVSSYGGGNLGRELVNDAMKTKEFTEISDVACSGVSYEQEHADLIVHDAAEEALNYFVRGQSPIDVMSVGSGNCSTLGDIVMARAVAVYAVRSAMQRALGIQTTSEDLAKQIQAHDNLQTAMWSFAEDYISRMYGFTDTADPNLAASIVCDVLAGAVGHLAWRRLSEAALTNMIGATAARTQVQATVEKSNQSSPNIETASCASDAVLSMQHILPTSVGAEKVLACDVAKYALDTATQACAESTLSRITSVSGGCEPKGQVQLTAASQLSSEDRMRSASSVANAGAASVLSPEAEHLRLTASRLGEQAGPKDIERVWPGKTLPSSSFVSSGRQSADADQPT